MSLIPLRPAGPNEHRCIIRQALDYYRHLVIGGVYISSGPTDNFRADLIKALKYCVAEHPILSAIIVDPLSEHPKFAKPIRLDLDKHISIEEESNSKTAEEWEQAQRAFLIKTLDEPIVNVSNVPPWKIAVLPETATAAVSDAASGPHRRFLILFAYGHSHGDGKSALAFHRSLLAGLTLVSSSPPPSKQGTSPTSSMSYDADPTCPTTSHALPPTIEMAAKLSLSTKYLLSPLLGQYLPKFLSNALGMRASAIPDAAEPWRGTPLNFYKNGDHVTGAAILRTPDATVQAALRACRQRRSRMTGLLHALVVRALSDILPPAAGGKLDKKKPKASASVTDRQCFVTQSAVDLRRNIGSGSSGRDGFGDDDMALCVTGYYEAFPRTSPKYWEGWTESAGKAAHEKDSDNNNDDDEPPLHPVWQGIAATTAGLEAQAATLHNQPIGLLRFLNDFKGWTRAHVGKEREASYELSNLTVFDPWRRPRRGNRTATAHSTGKQTHAHGQTNGEVPLTPGKWDIESMIFAQPANVTGGCFDTNVVTRKNGEMTITFSWQRGALGVEDEDNFMQAVATKVESGLQELADAEKNNN